MGALLSTREKDPLIGALKKKSEALSSSSGRDSKTPFSHLLNGIDSEGLLESLQSLLFSHCVASPMSTGGLDQLHF